MTLSLPSTLSVPGYDHNFPLDSSVSVEKIRKWKPEQNAQIDLICGTQQNLGDEQRSNREVSGLEGKWLMNIQPNGGYETL